MTDEEEAFSSIILPPSSFNFGGRGDLKSCSQNKPKN